MPPLPDRAAAAGDGHRRWDGQDLRAFTGTYGDYLLGKVSKVFPQLRRDVLEWAPPPSRLVGPASRWPGRCQDAAADQHGAAELHEAGPLGQYHRGQDDRGGGLQEQEQ